MIMVSLQFESKSQNQQDVFTLTSEDTIAYEGFIASLRTSHVRCMNEGELIRAKDFYTPRLG